MTDQHETEHQDIIPTRSFGGCDTCRRRHVKCDEGRPACFTCQSAGVQCSGYGREIFFSREDVMQAGNLRFRRTMFTERERASMSRTLTAMVPPSLATQQLCQIDNECDDVPETEEIEVIRGPFGAFRVGRVRTVSTTDDSPPWINEHNTPLQGLGSQDDNSLILLDAAPPYLPQNTEPPIIDDVEISEPDSFRLIDMALDSFEPSDVFDLGPAYPIQDFQFSSSSQPNHFVPPLLFRSWQSPSPRPVLTIPDSTVPPNAVTLLKHYSTYILDILTPFRHSKTPWHILFIPHAKHSLAALTLGEKLDHASSCVFYAILTLSAFSLGGISQSKTWTNHGKLYKQQAHEHCGKMLNTAYNVPKKAKYKSTLMALITMIQVSLCLDDRDQADYFFLEAEKFIRLRGLKRHKSRKVRLLHHCYVFWRMFHESTYVLAKTSDHRRSVIQAIEASGLVAYSSDSLSFRLPSWCNLEQEMAAIKDQQLAENDLHIEIPGTWPGTLYPEIFGIPEPWIFVLSLIIRLGKEKDAAENHEVPGPLPLTDFLSRAKSIEKFIGQLRAKRQADDLASVEHQPADRLTMQCLLGATLCALEIYFYRRIYDLDSSLLQQRVADVLTCLMRCVPADETTVHGSAGFIWPAFIAACEAEDVQMQTKFALWFKRFSQQTGLHMSRDIIGMVEQTWKEKNRLSGTTVTWLELMRQGKCIVNFDQ